MESYCADLYLRLSREDGDGAESDSISGQRSLLTAFLAQHPEIRLHQIRIDDGYSGVNFERPGFQDMMESVRKREINCIVVKDFSRLGRNFIETGKYIEKIFPFMGVRFISVNDGYDSVKPETSSDHLLIPVKNLLNESYSRDISIKIRSHLEMKRQKGQCIAPFTVYGYRKKEEDRHRLTIDEEPAAVIKEIFKRKLEGYSPGAIADWLNSREILSPMEYKRSRGSLYDSPFKKNPKARWTAAAVFRILKNPAYMGVLVQGKRSTPNYKVKKIIDLPKERWVSIPGSHEAIVSQETFERVAAMLETDTRTPPGRDKVHPLSGLVCCGDCGRNMIRKNNSGAKKPYIYYVCSGHKNKEGCGSSHSIRDYALEQSVLFLLRVCFSLMRDISIKEEFPASAVHTAEEEKRREYINSRQREKEKYQRYKRRVFEDYVEGLVSREDYAAWEKRYEDKIREAEHAIAMWERQERDMARSREKTCRQISFCEGNYPDIACLTRQLTVLFLERIWVYEERRIHIRLRFDRLWFM